MVCNIEIPADKVLEFQNAMGDNYEQIWRENNNIKPEWFIWPANPTVPGYWGMNGSHFHIVMLPAEETGGRRFYFGKVTIRPNAATYAERDACSNIRKYHLRPLYREKFVESASNLEAQPVYNAWNSVNPGYFNWTPVQKQAYEDQWRTMLQFLKGQFDRLLWDEWNLGWSG